MEIVSADVLAEVLELPLAALLVMVGLGLVLALTGWKWHRFWLTICVSMISGLVGIRQAEAWGIGQPVVSGVLMAAAAGCLALSLSRVGLFLAYGLICWYAMKRLSPPHAIPAICICAGGLFSVLFYRYCLILLTSGIGSILLCYGVLAYTEQQKWFSAMAWVKEQPLLANLSLAGVTLVTLLLQLAMGRKSRKKLAEYSTEELEAERRIGFPVRGRAA